MITQISIRQLRELKGYSQAELAKKLKISQSAFSLLEHGLYKAREASYIELSTILEVDKEYLKENRIPVFIFIDTYENSSDTKEISRNEEIKILLGNIIQEKKLLKEILNQE